MSMYEINVYFKTYKSDFKLKCVAERSKINKKKIADGQRYDQNKTVIRFRVQLGRT